MENPILLKIKEYSKSKGSQIACQFGNDSLSWADLEKRTDKMARQIQKLIRGNKKMPIIIYHARSIKFIEHIIAVMKCECFYVPLEHSTPAERVKYIYEDIGACLLLTDKVNCFDGNRYLVVKLEEYAESAEIQSMCADINGDDLIYVMYTSGTSGNPKGVKIMYSNLINLVASFFNIVYGNFKETVSVGVISSFSFDASVKQIFCSLYYGHTLHIADNTVRNFGRKLHKFHYENNLTLCDATPSLIDLMSLQKSKSVSQTPYLLIGGELLRWETLHRYTKFINHIPAFINVYGPTECCVDVAYKIISKEELEKNLTGIVPVGKSIENTVITIRSSEGEIIDSYGEEGELFVSGNQVGAGYVKIHSNSFFIENGNRVYKTGDIALHNYDGDIVVIGRRNDTQVKINGYRVELCEIEKVIENFLLFSCIVVYINQNKLIACIRTRSFADDEKQRLTEHLKNVLPFYMIPHFYFCADKFPLTKNGKADRIALERQLQNYTDN